MDSCYEYYTLLPLCFILIYFCRPLCTFLYSLLYIHSLIYTLIYYTAPHILHHSYILFYYILFYMPTIILSLIYPFIYSLLSYTLIALLILPRRFTPLSLILSYILAPLIFIFLYSHTPLLPYCYTHSLIWKGYNYAAADFYTLYIAILIFTAALISQLPYYIAFKEWKRRRQEL